MDSAPHTPVMLEETMELLGVHEGKWYVDVTFGRGGHTKAILDRGGYVLALDVDEEAIAHGNKTFTQALEKKRLLLVRENFEHIDQVIQAQSTQFQSNLDGLIADFGVSSPQLEKAGRGFSFQEDAPLDMRMDQRLGVTAKDIVNAFGKKELTEILLTYAGEHHARAIVESIIKARSRQPIETTRELANLVESVVHRTGTLHPATKTFMALRMVVNDELGVIDRMLPKAFRALQPEGKLVTISFHDGEDRLSKRFMKSIEEQGLGEMLTKRPLEPSQAEIDRNPRSRSAKVRGIKKI